MTSYIIKSVLCSGILLICYHLFLQKEKMFWFNRFYLLLSIVFSLIIPLLTIEVQEYSTPVEIARYIPAANQSSAVANTNQPITKNYNWLKNSGIYIYLLVTSILLIKLIKNLRKILVVKKNMDLIRFKDHKLVLLRENVAIFTFLDYIFISKEAYQNNLIEKEILIHELAHVKQKHSLDVLFIEVIQALFWFNPLLFFYKKAIQLNHEYLADEAVLKTKTNVENYQLLLLNNLLHSRQINLISSFNYSITKKRLAMMTTKTYTSSILVKKLALIPFTFLIVFTFTFRTQSQQLLVEPINREKKTISGQGVAQKYFDEYQNTIKEAVKTKVIKNVTRVYTDYSKLDRKRLDVIYRLMSDEQKAASTQVHFIPMGPPPVKTSPTQKQLDAWLDDKKYGVWLNEKQIKNEELKNHKPADFDYYYVSKLKKNAFNYGKHYFQIGVMTKKAFKKWQDEMTPLDAIPN